MAKNLTTDDLVTTSLRRALIPSNQSTFTCCDVRDILNEEMNTHVLPLVLRVHEEYYVVDEDISLSSGTTRYKIPYRAIGNKLRDVQYVTSSGNPYEMVRVSIEDRPEYQGQYGSENYLAFYLQSDEVVLMQDAPCTGSIRMSYYIRPNELVDDQRAGQVTEISNHFGCLTISSSICGDTVQTGGVTFTGASSNPCSDPAIFIASGAPATTATNLATAINNHSTVAASASASCNIVKITSSDNCNFSITYTDSSPVCCVTPAVVSAIKTEFTMDIFPEHFLCTTVYDIVQGKSPNTIKAFDIDVASVNQGARSISFPNSELQRIDPFSSSLSDISISVGDYISKSEETIVPQVPTELQTILAQRAAVKLLEALGDSEGMKNAQQELDRMESNALSLIDNRVEGAPQKISNKKSLLRSSVSNNLTRRRGI